MINYECPYLIKRENHVPMCRFYGRPCESVDCDEKEKESMGYFEPKDFLNIDKINEYVSQICKKDRADAIDEYMNKLCDRCIQTPNVCRNLECPFADDECQIVKIAEQLKEQNNDI